LTAGIVGSVIGKNASLSGAEGGCQAEIGSASAMAAAAIVEMSGGTPKQSFDAAAITIKNVMGLVCDPVAGLVEVPCAKRNAMGTANSLIAADMVLAGVVSVIPFDEVIWAMDKVGKSLPSSLRETSEGGVAVTPTGLRLKAELFEDNSPIREIK
jgi:L-serine dehydratase